MEQSSHKILVGSLIKLLEICFKQTNISSRVVTSVEKETLEKEYECIRSLVNHVNRNTGEFRSIANSIGSGKVSFTVCVVANYQKHL